MSRIKIEKKIVKYHVQKPEAEKPEAEKPATVGSRGMTRLRWWR